jgi:hypothetical protein
MSGPFKPTHQGGAALTLDSVEASILRSLTVQLLELIGPGDEPAADADPLAGLFTEGPSKAPQDPALARLFPDAYSEGPEAAEYSSEFRRFTENDLRTRKRENCLALVRSLDRAPVGRQGDVELELDADGCRSWLGALNDLRLTLGTRLEITDDDGEELYQLPDDDPRKPQTMAYLWLGWLEESLLEVLMDD